MKPMDFITDPRITASKEARARMENELRSAEWVYCDARDALDAASRAVRATEASIMQEWYDGLPVVTLDVLPPGCRKPRQVQVRRAIRDGAVWYVIESRLGIGPDYEVFSALDRPRFRNYGDCRIVGETT